MSEFRRQIADRVRNAKSATEMGDIISELIDRIEGEPPLIDGCRIIQRGDGNYVCKVHYRHWPVGSGICPGRRG